MKKALFAFLLTIFAIHAEAQNESQTAYNFLRLPVSARAAALGGDNVSLAEDDEALIFHNPALLSSVSDKTVNLNYMNYMSGVNTASAAFNRVVKERASWAVSAQYMDYGKMKEVDERNVQTGDFSAREIAVAGYFSYMLGRHIAGGVAAKLITSYIGPYSSLAFGVDLGLNYYHPDTEWSVSLVLKNIGGQLEAYHDNYDNMPIDMQLGATKRLRGIPLRVSATIVDLNHLDYSMADHLVLGADFLLTETFWIGGGYNFRRAREMRIISADGSHANGRAGLSIGTGLNLERFKLNVAYAKYHVSSSSVTVNAAYAL